MVDWQYERHTVSRSMFIENSVKPGSLVQIYIQVFKQRSLTLIMFRNPATVFSETGLIRSCDCIEVATKLN